MDLTNDDVADILALLDSLPYDALDLRTDRFRLTLRRTPGGWTEESEVLSEPADVTPEAGARAVEGASHAVGATGADVMARAGRVTGPGEVVGTGATPGADWVSGADSAEGLVAVVAPLPGTFYRAPRPGAPPFVEVGDEVSADTVVAIIETMKLMNSVHAGSPGRVIRILPGNGELVPLAATLLLINPDPAP